MERYACWVSGGDINYFPPTFVSYLDFEESNNLEMDLAWGFLQEIIKKTEAGLLEGVNLSKRFIGEVRSQEELAAYFIFDKLVMREPIVEGLDIECFKMYLPAERIEYSPQDYRVVMIPVARVIEVFSALQSLPQVPFKK